MTGSRRFYHEIDAAKKPEAPHLYFTSFEPWNPYDDLSHNREQIRALSFFYSMVEIALWTGFTTPEDLRNVGMPSAAFTWENYRRYVREKLRNPLVEAVFTTIQQKPGNPKFAGGSPIAQPWDPKRAANDFARILNILGEAYFDPGVRQLCSLPLFGSYDGTVSDLLFQFCSPAEIKKTLANFGSAVDRSRQELMITVFDALDHALAVVDLLRSLQVEPSGLATRCWHAQNLLFGNTIGIGPLLLEILKVIELADKRNVTLQRKFENIELENTKRAIWTLMHEIPIQVGISLGAKYSMIKFQEGYAWPPHKEETGSESTT